MLTVFNQQLWLLCKLQISGLRKKGENEPLSNRYMAVFDASFSRVVWFI